MARQLISGKIRGSHGELLRGADVYITLADTNLPATVYSAASGGVGIDSMPQLTTDNDGKVEFYMDPSEYASGQLFDIRVGDVVLNNVDVFEGEQGIIFPIIKGGTIDNTPIGQTTPAAGAFTTITGSGDMNIGSGVFFVDVSESKVGIGMTKPSELLHLEASAAPSIAIRDSDHNAGDYYAIRVGGITNAETWGLDWHNGSAGTDTRFITIQQGNPSILALIQEGGNLGIGITSFGTSLTKGIAMALGTAPTGTVADAIQAVVQDYAAGDARLYIYGEASLDPVIIGNGAIECEGIKTDKDSTAGNTRLLVYDVDNGTMARVSVGAADSGGTGYKVLRIPN